MDINSFLEKIFRLEEKGFVDECAELFLKVYNSAIFSNEEISKEIGLFYFRNGNYKNALIFFKVYLETIKDEELITDILQSYYFPNKEKYENSYYKSKETISKYKYIYINEFREYEKITLLPLFIDDESIIIFDSIKKDIVILSRKIDNIEKLELKDKEIFLNNVICSEKIKFLHEVTLNKDSISYDYFNICRPFYLYFKEDVFELYNQIFDIDEILKTKRVVLLVGINNLKVLNKLYNLNLPTFNVINFQFKDEAEDVEVILNDISKKRIQYVEQIVKEISNYYSENKENVLNNIKSGKPKILLLSSRFTSVIKNHIKSMEDVFERIGAKCHIFIEEDDISNYYFYNKIQEFKPDIIFTVNYFMYEFISNDTFFKGKLDLIFVTWIQDIFGVEKFIENYKKIERNNYILNHFIGWDKIKGLDYDYEHMMIDAPICADNVMYKKYELNQDEREKYSADICMIANIIDPYEYIDTLCKDDYKLRDILYKYVELSLNREELYFNNKEIQSIFSNILKDDYFYFNILQMELNYRIIRINIINTILESGFTNIKLWGVQWGKFERYKPYAMGVAGNGEELSKILQSSKIILGCHNSSSIQARAFETIFSGGFFLNNYVRPEDDICDIRKYLKDGTESIMFHSKKDLIEKIKFYLENEEERKKVIKASYKSAVKTMTFEALAKRIMEHLNKEL